MGVVKWSRMPVFDPKQAFADEDLGYHHGESERVSRQCGAILKRLKEGPATNRVLNNIALNYTGRISELRNAGHVVECFDHDRDTGLTRYRLKAEIKDGFLF